MEVPKITLQDGVLHRAALHEPQLAEQLVELPTLMSHSSSSRLPSRTLTFQSSCWVSLCCLWSASDIPSTRPLHPAVAVPEEYKRTLGEDFFLVFSAYSAFLDTRSRVSLRSFGLNFTHFFHVKVESRAPGIWQRCSVSSPEKYKGMGNFLALTLDLRSTSPSIQ